MEIHQVLPVRRGHRGFALLASLAVCLWAGGLAAVATAEGPERDATLIERENAREGATDWQLTRVRLDNRDGFRSPWIEGYCSKQSVEAGESLDIMVSTDPPGTFEIEVFRMGYYGGRGARLMTTLGPFEGKAQPTPKPGPKDLHECRWEPTTRLTIPQDWPSGVYLGRLTLLPPDETRRPGRATSSSSSATTGPPTSSSSAPTTPGRRTTAGPTTTRSTPTPRATRARGPT